MKTEPYASVMNGLRGVKMSEQVRARAESGARASAAIVELIAGMAGFMGLRAKHTENA